MKLEFRLYNHLEEEEEKEKEECPKHVPSLKLRVWTLPGPLVNPIIHNLEFGRKYFIPVSTAGMKYFIPVFTVGMK